MSAPRPQTILVVEDSDDDFHATARAFKKAGLANPVRRCTNGDQALDYLYRRGEFADPADAPRPGIILLDLNLPGTDGREVLRVAKLDPDLHKIPVVVLTTSDAEQDIQRCYDYGANSFVHKPVDLHGFVVAMTRLKEYWFEVAILPREGSSS
ncbi:MAG TPA: response regulator [Methylococcaceae bacterium]|nr:response regulator [Methylococcaceae bacterium]